ncbi:uncharacterized protein LAJ45_10788 [Morchella importuna]|uniref:uncharacterized protein n=1 Tax=Morchella importuna TaxID=1174673 RepID=UPI001E8DDA24|nr:uncharacterized protein LAJ45_10788 [Morchella importuna]KAH8145227.1 hypothetical protein LAJ45_10788 [Morchella importuna]
MVVWENAGNHEDCRSTGWLNLGAVRRASSKNFPVHLVAHVATRCHDSVDSSSYSQATAFERPVNHQDADDERCKVCLIETFADGPESEPCIRGHRSSKCNHSDRVLVQVRKPGRPLSSCPHTLSSTSPGTFVHTLSNGEDSGGNRAGSSARVSCSCDVTSVAIPKVASCACGTPKPQEPPPRLPPPSLVAITAATSDSGSTITSPMSPTFPAIVSASSSNNGPSNKVVKPQRLKKSGQARKGSVNIGEVALEQLLEQERERSSSAESLKMGSTANSCRGMPGTSREDGSAEGDSLRGFAGLPTSPGHGGDINGFRPPHDFSKSQNGNMFLEGIKPSESKPDMPAVTHKTLCSDVPNMWMYPTINPAITPQEFAWLQQQRAAGVFGPQPQLPGHALVPPMSNSPVANTALANGWEHSCHCGPECNCLGCATHPFNRRTVEHVREMQSFMAVDNGSLSPQSHPNPTNHNHPQGLVQQLSNPQPQPNSFEANGMSLSSPVAGAPSSGACCGTRASPAKQISPAPEEGDIGPDGSPNGTPSGTDGVDELSPSNFLYFDYPLGMCAQTEAGCKCGEGCTCVGCITHGGHDGVELEAPVQAPEWEAWGIEEGT